ncbi:MAG: RIO1 family regulatory kinase/ATPase [Actinomycetaceae bacterium]|nr:RIO1 family regulatory kinase/ATPase [Actinomycetaceae bacterium]
MNIPGYEIVGIIGFCALGPVWKVRDREGQMWAAKLSYTPDPEKLRLLQSLSCKNLVGVKEVIELEGRCVLVMELINGDAFDMAGATENSFKDILRALSVLHDVGLSHGDVSPANVLMCRDRTVLIDPPLTTARPPTMGYHNDEDDSPARDLWAWATMAKEAGIRREIVGQILASAPTQRPSAKETLANWHAGTPVYTPQSAVQEFRNIVSGEETETVPTARSKGWLLTASGIILACVGIGILSGSLGDFFDASAAGPKTTKATKITKITKTNSTPSSQPKKGGDEKTSGGRPRNNPSESQPAQKENAGVNTELTLAEQDPTWALNRILQARAGALAEGGNKLTQTSAPGSVQARRDAQLAATMKAHNIHAEGLKITVENVRKTNVNTFSATLVESAFIQCEGDKCRHIPENKVAVTISIAGNKLASVVSSGD